MSLIIPNLLHKLRETTGTCEDDTEYRIKARNKNNQASEIYGTFI